MSSKQISKKDECTAQRCWQRKKRRDRKERKTRECETSNTSKRNEADEKLKNLAPREKRTTEVDGDSRLVWLYGAAQVRSCKSRETIPGHPYRPPYNLTTRLMHL